MNAQFGTLAATDDGRWQLRYTRSLSHPPERVWRALTEPGELSAWFPADVVGERRAGARLSFPFREDEGPVLEGEMRIFDPPRLLEFTWDTDVLRFELEPSPNGSVLHFTATIDEQGRGVRDGSGWHFCLDHLEALLDATAPPEDAAARVVELQKRYRELMGAEAATVVPPGGWESGTG